MIVGGIIIGAIIVGGWYVTGHLGYLAEDPRTLEEAFVATNSGKTESYSASSRPWRIRSNCCCCGAISRAS